MKRILALLIGFGFIISSPAQKIKLALNLTKGATYAQHTISSMSLIQHVNGQEMNINMDIKGTLFYKVTDIQDSVYHMEVKYEDLLMKMALPGTDKEFSSAKADSTDIMSTVLGALKNKPFYIKMTKTGKITEVTNFDALFAGAFEQLHQLPEAQKQQIREQLEKSYGEKAMKGGFEMVTAIFPDKPVAKGDKWEIKTRLEATMPASVKTIYELKEITDAYAVISGASKMETDKEAYVQSNGMQLKYNMTGDMTATIKINRQTGWIVDAKMSQTIKGTGEMKDNPQIPGGMTIPMTINTEITITEK